MQDKNNDDVCRTQIMKIIIINDGVCRTIIIIIMIMMVFAGPPGSYNPGTCLSDGDNVLSRKVKPIRIIYC